VVLWYDATRGQELGISADDVNRKIGVLQKVALAQGSVGKVVTGQRGKEVPGGRSLSTVSRPRLTKSLHIDVWIASTDCDQVG